MAPFKHLQIFETIDSEFRNNETVLKSVFNKIWMSRLTLTTSIKVNFHSYIWIWLVGSINFGFELKTKNYKKTKKYISKEWILKVYGSSGIKVYKKQMPDAMILVSYSKR